MPILKNIIGFIVLLLISTVVQAGNNTSYQLFLPNQLAWQPAPKELPQGSQITTLVGDINKKGLFTLRYKMPPNAHYPAHAMSQQIIVTVISGTFHIGFGNKFIANTGLTLPTGSVLVIAPNAIHYAWTGAEGAIIQITGMGPRKVLFKKVS